MLLLEPDTCYGLLVWRIVRVRTVEDGSQVDLGFPLSLPGSAPGLREGRFRAVARQEGGAGLPALFVGRCGRSAR